MRLLLQDQRGWGESRGCESKSSLFKYLSCRRSNKMTLKIWAYFHFISCSLTNPAKQNLKYQANVSRSILFCISCQHCSLLPSARQMRKYCMWGNEVYFWKNLLSPSSVLAWIGGRDRAQRESSAAHVVTQSDSALLLLVGIPVEMLHLNRLVLEYSKNCVGLLRAARLCCNFP